MREGTNARKTLPNPRRDLHPRCSLRYCWRPLGPVGDPGPDIAPQVREGIRGVKLEVAGGGQYRPGNPEALPALSWARRPHAKMEHGRLPPASWDGNRARLSGKCTQLGCADGGSGSREVMTPILLREPPAGSSPQGWGQKSHSHFTDRHLRLSEGTALSRSFSC